MHDLITTRHSKVPPVTIAFWLIKIAATTLGETGGDTLSMTFNLGYAVATAVFFPLFVASVVAQVRAKQYHPFLYWLVIVTTTTAGTTMADFADRSLGIGYTGGMLILFALVLLVLGTWRAALGSVSATEIFSAKAEAFYWAAILASNTLGTAMGDFTSDDSGLGYLGSAGFFSVLLLGLAGLYVWGRISRVLLFWAAFILTRPLGATLGDFLTKPVSHGGLHFSRPVASAVLAVGMVAGIVWANRRRGVA